MKSSTAIRSCARHLARILCQGQGVPPEEIFRAMAGLSHPLRKKVLRCLEQEICREASRNTCILESVGELPATTRRSMERSFSRKMGRPIALTSRENPHLLGGVRVIIGDLRWENSLRAAIERFRS
jgi:F0F1-type ATP synthase delta subunit